MFRFVLRRLAIFVPVMFVIVTMTFFMVKALPGDPFTAERAMSPEVKAKAMEYYGLDLPTSRQYLRYLGNLVPKRFLPHRLFQDANDDGRVDFDLIAAFGVDFGPSFKYTNRSVNEIISDGLPVSLELGMIGLVVALVLGIPAGIVAAVGRNTWRDFLASGISMVGICLPTFVLGPLLVLAFAIGIKWFNASGWDSTADRVLPGITLGFVYAAYVARLTRGGMLEVLSQDYVRTARAKGASELRVILRHTLRGGLLPVVSFLGPAAAGILTGSFVVESVFQVPGLGREFVKSVGNRDYFLILGCAQLYAGLLITFNLIVDVVQVWLNPKLKFD